jgi:hypothetical protein
MKSAHLKVGTIQFETSSRIASSAGEINSQLKSSATADDIYNNGTLFFSTLSQFTRIVDYDASSGQWSWSTVSLSTAVISTVVSNTIPFGYTTPEFTYEVMVELANDALRAAGPIVRRDRTLQSSASQLVYPLPVAAKYGRPFRVQVAGRTGSTTDDPSWIDLFPGSQWDLQPSTAGGSNLLVFNEQLPSGRDIQIWFQDHHGRVDVSTALIDEAIHPELAVLLLVEKMYEYRNSRARGAEEFDIQRWNDAKQQVSEARIRWPITAPRRKPKLMIPGYVQTGQTRVLAPSTGVTS